MRTITAIATVSAASNRESAPIDLGDSIGYSVHTVISGADIAGTLKLQSSNDNTNWVDVANSSVSITSAADNMHDISNAQYRYVKVVWTATSGTGNMTCTFIGKDPYIGRV